jgi:hypothetical protein
VREGTTSRRGIMGGLSETSHVAIGSRHTALGREAPASPAQPGAVSRSPIAESDYVFR